ncbi:MAG: DUF3524 domain-containing protein [Desulfobacterales bacterium]|nr:DUF3524 domain-containing protein [Desulfobacterales bacterium]
MKFLFVEPFYGGSHKNFADGLVAHSRQEIELMGLPPRFWKWRMRGAGLEFFRRLPDPRKFHGIIATNLMSAADFKALLGAQCPPMLVYFHENQITYPVAPGQPVDYHYGFTDITSALVARRVLFNSHSHLSGFLTALPEFIGMMPDMRPNWTESRIRQKAGVCLPGCHFPGHSAYVPSARQNPPLVIWNHRWEHDKNPGPFFDALYAVADRGIDFRAAILGQSFANRPPEFDAATDRLPDQIVQFGYASPHETYIDWLKRGTVVVSTALQENFGISVVEAARYGCLPLLPERLSYPEIIPREFHETLLYRSEGELVEKLADILLRPDAYEPARKTIAAAMSAFSWQHRIGGFDAELEALAEPGPGTER